MLANGGAVTCPSPMSRMLDRRTATRHKPPAALHMEGCLNEMLVTAAPPFCVTRKTTDDVQHVVPGVPSRDQGQTREPRLAHTVRVAYSSVPLLWFPLSPVIAWLL